MAIKTEKIIFFVMNAPLGFKGMANIVYLLDFICKIHSLIQSKNLI